MRQLASFCLQLTMIVRSILLIGFLSLPSYALYFHIAETERKCFIEEIPDETMVIGNYKVQLYDPQTKGFLTHAFVLAIIV